MQAECLNKVRKLVEAEDFKDFKQAYDSGDATTWNRLLDELSENLTVKQRQTVIDVNKRTGLLDYLNDSTKGLGGKAKDKMLLRATHDLASGAGTRQSSGIVSLDVQAHTLGQHYISKLTDIVHKGRPKVLGLDRSRNLDFTKNLLKTIMGESGHKVSKTTQLMADAWIETLESIRKHFNRAGGDIPRWDKYFLPNAHDIDLISAVSKEEWVAFADEHFDIVWKKGKQKTSKQEILENAYDRIIGGDDSPLTLENTKPIQLRKLANKHQTSRVLQAKDADSWFKYNERFGRHNNPIDSMLEYVNGITTEIAAMEIFGTNPSQTFHWLTEQVRQRTRKNTKIHFIRKTFNETLSQQPPHADGYVRTFQALRNFQTATKLTLTPITAASDTVFESTRAMFNGINPVRVLARHLKNLNPLDHADRLRAGEIGLGLDYALNRAAAMNRYNDTINFGTFHKMADFSTRLSGLNHWTNSGKIAFGLETSSIVAKMSSKEFSNIPGGLRRALERYGVTEADWPHIQKAIRDVHGMKLVDVTQEGVPQDVRTKFLGMMRSETQMAIPEPNAKAHAYTNLGTDPGTFTNQAMKVFTQFKVFSVSSLLYNFGTILDRSTPTINRLTYGSSLLMGSAVIGSLIIQAKDIAKGRTPRELSPQLIGEGLLQVGFLGVWADLMFRDPREFGGYAGWLGGPTIGDTEKLGKVLWGTFEEAQEGGKWFSEKLLPATVDQATKNAFPLQMWYSRLAAERMFLTNLNKMVDPNWNQKNRKYKRWLKEKGQEPIFKN